jgi:hypothetical protein
MRRRLRDIFRRHKSAWPARVDMVIVMGASGATLACALMMAVLLTRAFGYVSALDAPFSDLETDMLAWAQSYSPPPPRQPRCEFFALRTQPISTSQPFVATAALPSPWSSALRGLPKGGLRCKRNRAWMPRVCACTSRAPLRLGLRLRRPQPGRRGAAPRRHRRMHRERKGRSQRPCQHR